MIVDLTESHKITERTVVVISDVHGYLDKLNDVLEQVMGYGAQVVFVGDYIDRGPSGVEVLKLVRDMEYHPKDWGFSKVTALLGNHEKMALDAVEEETRPGLGSDGMSLWLHNGGRIEEFPAIRHDFSPWLRSLRTCYKHKTKVHFRGEPKNLVVTHGSIDPSRSLEHQQRDTLVWGRSIRGWDSETVVVNGHTPCESGQPEVYNTDSGTVVRIDTGVCYGGDITGLLLEECDS